MNHRFSDRERQRRARVVKGFAFRNLTQDQFEAIGRYLEMAPDSVKDLPEPYRSLDADEPLL